MLPPERDAVATCTRIQSSQYSYNQKCCQVMFKVTQVPFALVFKGIAQKTLGKTLLASLIERCWDEYQSRLHVQRRTGVRMWLAQLSIEAGNNQPNPSKPLKLIITRESAQRNGRMACQPASCSPSCLVLTQQTNKINSQNSLDTVFPRQ